jgi:hypothetical protein
MWLERLTMYQNLYQLIDVQNMQVARFKGEYAAKESTQPCGQVCCQQMNITLHNFKELF